LPRITRSFRTTLALWTCLGLGALALAPARPAHAGFHLVEITKILASYNGDATIQAVEMKMIANSEHLVGTAFIKVYGATGVAGATLGTFGANLSATGSVTGARILCATTNFATTFGITPDLVITPGITAPTGQVTFEKTTCPVNAVAYGGVTTFVHGGTTAASPLPSLGAPVLVRVTDNSTLLSCPQPEDAAARFQLRSATPTTPISFTNYAGASVNLASTVTGVETTPPAAVSRARPNPFGRDVELRIRSRGDRILIHDVSGRLVRTLRGNTPGSGGEPGILVARWDGTDQAGRATVAGIYFARGNGAGDLPLRIVRFR
jgi:hypothetical protein